MFAHFVNVELFQFQGESVNLSKLFAFHFLVLVFVFKEIVFLIFKLVHEIEILHLWHWVEMDVFESWLFLFSLYLIFDVFPDALQHWQWHLGSLLLLGLAFQLEKVIWVLVKVTFGQLFDVPDCLFEVGILVSFLLIFALFLFVVFHRLKI